MYKSEKTYVQYLYMCQKMLSGHGLYYYSTTDGTTYATSDGVVDGTVENTNWLYSKDGVIMMGSIIVLLIYMGINIKHVIYGTDTIKNH